MNVCHDLLYGITKESVIGERREGTFLGYRSRSMTGWGLTVNSVTVCGRFRFLPLYTSTLLLVRISQNITLRYLFRILFNRCNCINIRYCTWWSSCSDIYSKNNRQLNLCNLFVCVIVHVFSTYLHKLLLIMSAFKFRYNFF